MLEGSLQQNLLSCESTHTFMSHRCLLSAYSQASEDSEMRSPATSHCTSPLLKRGKEKQGPTEDGAWWWLPSHSAGPCWAQQSHFLPLLLTCWGAECKLKFFHLGWVSNAGVLQGQLVKPNHPVHGTCLCLGFVWYSLRERREEEKRGRGQEEEKRVEQGGENTRNFKK